MGAPAFTIEEYQGFAARGKSDDVDVPVMPEAQLMTPYKTYFVVHDIHDDRWYAYFKVYLFAGYEYTIFIETNKTLGDFHFEHAALYHWNPWDVWQFPSGKTYDDEDEEDTAPYNDPYDYKLNVNVEGVWTGGRRYTFTALVTGFHIFGSFYTGDTGHV